MLPIGLQDLSNLQWDKVINEQTYCVSTSRNRIDLEFVSSAFTSGQMPWAKRMSDEELTKMLDNSLTFGLYQQTTSSDRTTTQYQQIGIARLITDHTTFAYLTDVLILPGCRRLGHARWMMACVREVIETMPALRRGMLLTGLPYGETFYKETLGTYNVTEEYDHLLALTGKFKRRQD